MRSRGVYSIQLVTWNVDVRMLEGTVVVCLGCCPPTETSIVPGNTSHCVVHSCISLAVTVNISCRVSEGESERVSECVCVKYEGTSALVSYSS